VEKESRGREDGGVEICNSVLDVQNEHWDRVRGQLKIGPKKKGCKKEKGRPAPGLFDFGVFTSELERKREGQIVQEGKNCECFRIDEKGGMSRSKKGRLIFREVLGEKGGEEGEGSLNKDQKGGEKKEVSSAALVNDRPNVKEGRSKRLGGSWVWKGGGEKL